MADDFKDPLMKEKREKFERQSKIKIDDKTKDEVRAAVLPDMIALVKANLALQTYEATLPRKADTNEIDNSKLTEDQKKRRDELVKQHNNAAYDGIAVAIERENKTKKWFDATTQDGKDRIEILAQPLVNQSLDAARVITGGPGRKLDPNEEKEAKLLAALATAPESYKTTPQLPAAPKQKDKSPER